MFDILTGAFRALHECRTKLEGLSLPGSDNMSEPMSIKDRMGIIPIPALLTIPRSTPEAAKKTLLLPLFQNLKTLELKLDFAHPGTQSTFKYVKYMVLLRSLMLTVIQASHGPFTSL